MSLLWTSFGTVPIPARPVGFWTLAQEYVPGNRLLRITVLHEDQNHQALTVTWNPAPNSPCSPDGLPVTPGKSALLCANAAYGAVIGKIGGSTGDLPDSTPGLTAPWGNKKVFAVGWDCILSLTSQDGGPLFLTMNDHNEQFAGHSGELVVWLRYYPL